MAGQSRSAILFRQAVKSLIFFGIYFLVGTLGVKIHKTVGYYPMIWFPAGVGLGILVVCGESFWPVLFASATTLGLSQHFPLAPSLLLGGVASIDAVLGARFLKYFTHTSQPKLVTIKETLVLVFFAMGVSSLISSTLAVSGLRLLGSIPPDMFIFTLKVWWFSSAMGDLIIGTAIICSVNDIHSRLSNYRFKKFEFLGLFAIVCLVCSFVYTPLSTFNHTLIIRPYFLFPIMIWMAIRFDTLGVTLVNIVLMVTMLVGAMKGVLPVGVGSVDDRMFIQQLIAMTLGITGLVLSAAIREKEVALDEKSEFISIASHELKTPITSLKLQYDLMERTFLRSERLSEDEVTTLYKKTRQHISRLTRSVDQLLSTARLEHGVAQLNVSRIELSTLVKSVLDGMSANLSAAKSEARLNIEEDMVVNWDLFRMEQVISNILSNAIKYAPGKPIEVTVGRAESLAHIRIQDHGPGIHPSKKKHIFNRFVRATDSKVVEGLGLGLFISRQIVVAHGGDIQVQSSPGTGAIFDINVPASLG